MKITTDLACLLLSNAHVALFTSRSAFFVLLILITSLTFLLLLARLSHNLLLYLAISIHTVPNCGLPYPDLRTNSNHYFLTSNVVSLIRYNPAISTGIPQE